MDEQAREVRLSQTTLRVLAAFPGGPGERFTATEAGGRAGLPPSRSLPGPAAPGRGLFASRGESTDPAAALTG
jgi:hypothetical protein